MAESSLGADTVAGSTGFPPGVGAPGPTWLAPSWVAWRPGGGLPSAAGVDWFWLLVWVEDIFRVFRSTSFPLENTKIDDGNGNGTSAARVEG